MEQDSLDDAKPMPSKPVSHDSEQPSWSRDTVAALLQFLADASNETLGACLVGLAIVTILVLGRLGSVLIGVVAGVVLHAAWRGGHATTTGNAVRAKIFGARDSGVEVALRVLDWQAQKKMIGDDGESEADNKPKKDGPETQTLDFSTLPPEIGLALGSYTDAVVRDYVRWWYSPILPEERTFISACKDTLSSFILSVASHLARKRPADIFLDSLANTSSIFIVFLSELGNALSTSMSGSMSLADEIHEYMASHPESNLTNLVDETHQRRKLYIMTDDILQNFLDPTVYRCKPAFVFLREIFAGVILKTTLESCSKPDWVNGWIIHLLEGTEMQPIKPDATSGTIESGESGREDSFDILRAVEPPTGDSDHSSQEFTADGSHAQSLSKADAAMKQAILEAERMNQLIEEENTRRKSMEARNRGQSTSDLPTHNIGPATAKGSESPDPTLHLTRLQAEQGGANPNDNSRSYFTSFDQLIPDRTPTALQANLLPKGSDGAAPGSSSSALYKANVSILDDSASAKKGETQAKSKMEYLIQIEPFSSSQGGWMIARKYADFESLHEVLRRISVVSGLSSFQLSHASLPSWKGQKKSVLQSELEKYLKDALSYRQLAESEGMKRFLEKSQGFGRPSPSTVGKGGFPAAFGSMGKGVLDAIASTPKGVGGVLGGVSSLAQKKDSKSPSKTEAAIDLNAASSHGGLGVSNSAGIPISATDEDISKSPTSSSSHVPKASPLERWSGDDDDAVSETNSSSPVGLRAPSKLSLNEMSSTECSQSSPGMDTPQRSPQSEKEEIHLPPLPTEIPDDYGPGKADSTARPFHHQPGMSEISQNGRPSIDTQSAPDAATSTHDPASSRSSILRKEVTPLTEQETQVAIDLSFAVINELYNLSSAWNIRRTLLTAAKNFLNLDTMRTLIQNSIIDANSSEEAIAGYIRQMEENTVPREEQRAAWPPPPTDEDKENRRVKARRLLVEKGLPPALTGVMGNAASKEALGKVFDSLQVEEVSRGLVFGLLLQALRVLSQ